MATVASERSTGTIRSMTDSQASLQRLYGARRRRSCNGGSMVSSGWLRDI